MQLDVEKPKLASMVKLERSPSHSWWWDSHNSPRHSKWLQSNLQDLDDKVKAMLQLVEEDADSFAQRAEMYYQKRPELINLVEEFYRAYRSLAERYDHLTGEIRQNVPRAVQVQYGLSCDSPRSMGGSEGRHHHSPLRRSSQLFENLFKKACRIDNGGHSSAEEGNQKEDSMQVLHDTCSDDDMGHGFDNGCIESHPNSSDEGVLSSSSDSEVDNLTPINRLRKEIEELKETNKVLAKSHEKMLQLNSALESKLRNLEEGYRVKEEEANSLRSRLPELNVELVAVVSREQHGEAHAEHGSEEPQKKQFASLVEEESEEEIEISSSACEDMHGSHEPFKSVAMDVCKHEYCSSGTEGSCKDREASFDSLEDQVAFMREENRKQELIILERGEEKREAIRQLCFSMDALKSENQRLEQVIGALRKKLCAHNAGTDTFCRAFSQSPFAAWMQLFAVGFKARQPFVAVAL